jgi:DNA-binding transcriptional LysR family regulator
MGTIDLNDLGVFACVAETSSFSKAAARLGVPKSSVSRAIARLEEALSVSVFHRNTRNVALSTSGKALYQRVAVDVASLREVVRQLPDLERELQGRLSVTAPPSTEDFLAEVITRYSGRHRGVELDLHLTTAKVDLVAQGVDLALRFSTTRLRDSSLNAKRLGPSRMWLYAAPAYLARQGTPRTARDLDEHEWVVYRHTTELRLEGAGATTVVKTRGRIATDDFALNRRLLGAGCGIGYLPGYYAEGEVAAGTLVRVLPQLSATASHLWAVWPGKLPRKTAAFLDVVVETLRTRPM